LFILSDAWSGVVLERVGHFADFCPALEKDLARASPLRGFDFVNSAEKLALANCGARHFGPRRSSAYGFLDLSAADRLHFGVTNGKTKGGGIRQEAMLGKGSDEPAHA